MAVLLPDRSIDPLRRGQDAAHLVAVRTDQPGAAPVDGEEAAELRPNPAAELSCRSTLAALDVQFASVRRIRHSDEYRIDRSMFHVCGSLAVRRASAIRMGRMTEIPDNDPVFGSNTESIVRDWCQRSKIPFGGHADIGHDAANRVVPFHDWAN